MESRSRVLELSCPEIFSQMCGTSHPSSVTCAIRTKRRVVVVQEGENPYEVHTLSPVLNPNALTPIFIGQAFLGSLLAMLPWPLLGIAACYVLGLFEKATEVVMMFGGVTLVFLLPLGLFVTSEWIFCVLIGIVWLIVLLLPLCFGKRILSSPRRVLALLACQALFSASQSGLGFLLMLGKQI